MPAPTDKTRERLRFRSRHRGIKEMDILLGTFAARHLDSFTEPQLAEYEALLAEQDQDLYDWLLARATPPPEKMTSVLKLFLAHLPV